MNCLKRATARLTSRSCSWYFVYVIITTPQGIDSVLAMNHWTKLVKILVNLLSCNVHTCSYHLVLYSLNVVKRRFGLFIFSLVNFLIYYHIWRLFNHMSRYNFNICFATYESAFISVGWLVNAFWRNECPFTIGNTWLELTWCSSFIRVCLTGWTQFIYRRIVLLNGYFFLF